MRELQLIVVKIQNFLWKINHLHLAITWAMQRETAHCKKNVQKGIAGPTYLLSPSPKPNVKIYCLLGEKLSTLKCKPQNLQQLISPCKTMKKAVCLTSRAGREWLGMRGDFTSPPSCWSFWASNFRKIYPPCHWPGKPWKRSIVKRKDFWGMGHVPEKFCGIKVGDFRVWGGTIIPGRAEIWSLLSLCILVYRSLWLTDKISCLGDKHNKIKPWQGMSL